MQKLFRWASKWWPGLIPLAVMWGFAAWNNTLPVEADQTRPRYHEAIIGLPAGVTHFALHATVPGEIESIAPDHAGWRTREFALFASGAVAEWCAEAGIAPIGYRDIQRLWQAGSTNPKPRPAAAAP